VVFVTMHENSCPEPLLPTLLAARDLTIPSTEIPSVGCAALLLLGNSTDSPFEL
jgi:hypothetical protein